MKVAYSSHFARSIYQSNCHKILLKTIRHNQLKSAYWSFSQYSTRYLMVACSIITCVIWYYLRISHWTNRSQRSAWIPLFFCPHFHIKSTMHLIALRTWYALLRYGFDWVCASNWTMDCKCPGTLNELRLLVSITSGTFIWAARWKSVNCKNTLKSLFAPMTMDSCFELN